MLIALEGPNGAGKTTLFNALREAEFPGIYIPKRPFPRILEPLLHVADSYNIPLWRALLATKQQIIVDRCPWISVPVYSQLFNREQVELATEEFVKDILVVYVRVEPEILIQRAASTERAPLTLEVARRLVQLYDATIQPFNFIQLDGSAPPDVNVEILCERF